MGKVALYGIYFDTDKATLKPESGHTDSTGDFEHNRKLSEARAQSVVKELTGKHGVAAHRLKAGGVGPLAPVASNRTEQGKAKNRRVELVEQ